MRKIQKYLQCWPRGAIFLALAFAALVLPKDAVAQQVPDLIAPEQLAEMSASPGSEAHSECHDKDDSMHHEGMHGDAMQGHDKMAASADAHPFVRQMNADMAKMMQDMHAPGYTGNWDVDFLAMMVPHHQGAIDMARLVLAYGKDPQVRRLAEEIIAAQLSEIDFMTKHLEVLRKGEGQ